MKNLKVGDKVRCTDPSNSPLILHQENTVIEDGNGIVQIDDGTDNWYKMDRFEPVIKDLPLAVRVTNEREFKALMEDYEERLSYHWIGHYKATEFKPKKFTFPCAVAFKNSFAILWDYEELDYTLISFLDYVKITGLILPASIQLAEGATATLSDGRIEFDESVMSLAKSDIINLFNLIN